MPDTPSPAPSLVGVWTGSSSPAGAGATPSTATWLEISSQSAASGTLGGHLRWNVPDAAAEEAAVAAGSDPERFDAVAGRLGADGRTVQLATQTSGDTLDGTLADAATLQAVFTPADGSPGFTVTLALLGADDPPATAGVVGLDVSHHSGTVDWPTVAAQGYRFAYVKASEGVDDADPLFTENWQALRATGMARGAYHFYVTEDDPEAQARFFASRLGDDLGTLPPAVDVELLGANTEGDLTDALLAFLRAFEAATGVRPMIYSSPGFWDQSYRPEFAAYPLWVAEYGVTRPRVPFGWQRWQIWQRAENQAVPGVAQSADLDVLHPGIDLDSLRPAPPG